MLRKHRIVSIALTIYSVLMVTSSHVAFGQVAHNAVPEEVQGVARNLHMKPSYIGKLAQQENVKKLLLTHLMKRSLAVKTESRDIIKMHYKGDVIFPNDLDIFKVTSKK